MAAVLPTGHLLKKLRCLMQSSSVGCIHAYIVPSGDAHQSEYIADCDSRRQFISKFSGSNGTAVITLDKAALWTDGRYHLQASKQLELTNWLLMKDGLPETPSQGDWLKDTLKSGDKVGVDPLLMSHDTWKTLSKELRSRNISLVGVAENLIDMVWEDSECLLPSDTARPKRPSNKLLKLDVNITGKEWRTKVAELRDELRKKKCGAILLTALDQIAWLLNLRGSDIAFNPVFFAYSIVTLDKVVLFIDKEKITPEVCESLGACFDGYCPPATGCSAQDVCVQIKPYDSVLCYIHMCILSPSPDLKEDKLIWLSKGSSEGMIGSIPKSRRYFALSPVTKAKAIKNEVEIENMRQCHVRDAAALCEYLAWLEKMIEANPDGHEQLWEITGADYLEECRKQQEHFMGLSFPSISGSGPNGAVIHYHPEEATKRPIGRNEMYLIDSGAQYLDGTTDVTRTVHFGEPTAKERECFTLVLKGHIQLARAIFPHLVKGNSLDTFARQYLWSQGLNYLHGTGHGVGMFLNVHEGPTSISPRGSAEDPGLEVGQILSNEPGYYENGAFGIRIENLVVVQKAETRYQFNGGQYLRLESITLVPIQSKLIDMQMLTDGELEWLNEYHATCRQRVGAHLDKMGGPSKGEVKEWLVKATEPLKRH